jgi:hypothetical protein
VDDAGATVDGIYRGPWKGIQKLGYTSMESRLKTPTAYEFSLNGTTTHTLPQIVPFEIN